MIPYIINTVLSCFFVYLGTREEKKRRRLIWIILAIFIPSVLAGARDASVGTDTAVYGVPYFKYALNRNFENYMLTAGGDTLWLLFVYGISRITTEVFWELFLIEVVIMFFTYNALRQYNLGKYTWVGFLVFHLMFYSFTLNLMRQFVCVSIVLYSFKFVKEHKLKQYLLICCILFFIQKTAIMAIVLYPMYHLIIGGYQSGFLKNIKFSYKKFMFKCLIIIGTCMVVLFASKWIPFISNLLGTFTSQVKYLTSYNFVWRILIYMLPLAIIMLIFEKNVSHNNSEFEFFNLLLIIYIVLWQLQGISRESYRIGFYFGYFIVISIPMLIKEMRKSSNRVIILGILFVIMIVFYLDYFVVHMYNETYPYTSTLLGIG